MDFSSYLCHLFINSFSSMIFELFSKVPKPPISHKKDEVVICDYSCHRSI